MEFRQVVIGGVWLASATLLSFGCGENPGLKASFECSSGHSETNQKPHVDIVIKGRDLRFTDKKDLLITINHPKQGEAIIGAINNYKPDSELKHTTHLPTPSFLKTVTEPVKPYLVSEGGHYFFGLYENLKTNGYEKGKSLGYYMTQVPKCTL